MALSFVRVLYAGEDLADRLWRGPDWLRPAAGGVLLGGLLLVLPQMYGVGYPVLESAVRGHYVIGFLLLLLVGKVIATSLTIAIGGSGGVFAPSLFMGAMLGSGYGQALRGLIPGTIASPGAYGLVGMAAVFAAAARAPITAVLIIFELTGDYPIILPLMVAVGIATGVAGLLSRDSIYTLKLRRRGIDVDRPRPTGPMQLITVGEAMRTMPEPVSSHMALADLVIRFADDDEDALPVVGDDGALLGVVSADDVESSLDYEDARGSAGQLARPAPQLRADQPLEAAAQNLAESEEAGLPVLAASGPEIAGWITHRDVLRAYRRGSRPVSNGDGDHDRVPRPGGGR